MRFPYTVTGPTQNEFDSLPRLPLTLQLDRRRVEANSSCLCLESQQQCIVDSGANEFLHGV